MQRWQEGKVTRRVSCRVCGSEQLTALFDLGEQYVNDFVDAEHVHSGVKVPIRLQLCQQCGLVQQEYTAPQELLYTKHYWYRSATTQTMRDALKDITQAVEKTVKLNTGDIVLDIGSNDGTLLRSYTTPGIVKVGFEPAANLALAGSAGVDLLVHAFWDAAQYYNHVNYDLPRRALANSNQAKVVTAIGMFYDLEDPNAFIADVARVLADDGVFVAQLMCLRQTLERGDVGNYCHEHLEFYSLRCLESLFKRHGLELMDLEENTVNGGSYRLWCRKLGQRYQGRLHWTTEQTDRICDALGYEEDQLRVEDSATYQQCYQAMLGKRDRTMEFIRAQIAQKKRIWVYGSSTKGNTILQWYGLDHHLIEGAADKSPEKWGKYTVGTGIRIFSEEEARLRNPDFFLVLPYAFIDEFVQREQKWLQAGGTFIVPLPEPRLIDKDGEHSLIAQAVPIAAYAKRRALQHLIVKE